MTLSTRCSNTTGWNPAVSKSQQNFTLKVPLKVTDPWRWWSPVVMFTHTHAFSLSLSSGQLSPVAPMYKCQTSNKINLTRSVVTVEQPQAHTHIHPTVTDSNYWAGAPERLFQKRASTVSRVCVWLKTVCVVYPPWPQFQHLSSDMFSFNLP